MRSTHFLLFVLLAACGTPRPDPHVQPIPQAFQEKTKLESVTRDSYDSDVVQDLFNEELEHDTALAGLFKRLQAAQATFSDSAEASNTRRSQNASFYTSANSHLMELDSVERGPWNARITESSKAADARLAPFSILTQEFAGLSHETAQLRTMVMLDRTLRRMEAFQRTPVPGKAGMENTLRDLRLLRNALRAELKE